MIVTPPLKAVAVAIVGVLKCTEHPPRSWLLFFNMSASNAPSCPPQLVVTMPLAMLPALVVPKNSTVHPHPLAEQQKSVANGVEKA
jgi:hypothetical protein